MKRARLGAVIGALGAACGLIAGLADCHEPTEIEIDVRTDSCSAVKSAGIAVGTRDKIEGQELAAFSDKNPGCRAPGDRIGTLVIYPSGAKDAEVAVRVVVGIDRNASECKEGDYAGCIVARRYLKFVPGEAQKIIVVMQGKCTGKDCGPAAECKEGGCVVELPDGGTLDAGPPLEGGPVDASEDAPADAPEDVIADTGVDACAACPGNCVGTQCSIDCSKTNCNSGNVCPAGFDCQISCPATGSCANANCTAPNKSCRFDCTSVASACGSLLCNADRCYVYCTGNNVCSGAVTISGGDASIECQGGGSCTNGQDYCDAGHCGLVCKETMGPNCASVRKCYANDAAGGCVGPWQ